MSSNRARTITVAEAPPAKSVPKLTCVNYLAVSCILAGVYVIVTKDNQLYYTNPHGFDYFLNLILAIQYSSAVNILVGGFLELSCGDVPHTRWINFWNFLFYFIFPLYAVLASAAAGYYDGALWSDIANTELTSAAAGTRTTSEAELRNNSIIVMCVICVLNYGLVPIYVLTAWCCDPCKLLQ